MANTYGRNATQVQKDAVAKLMLYCGQAVQMDYTPSSSGAQTMFLPQILVQSFNYPSTAHNINRYGYTIEQWDSLLLNELRNKRPVLYTGYTTASEGDKPIKSLLLNKLARIFSILARDLICVNKRKSQDLSGETSHSAVRPLFPSCLSQSPLLVFSVLSTT